MLRRSVVAICILPFSGGSIVAYGGEAYGTSIRRPPHGQARTLRGAAARAGGSAESRRRDRPLPGFCVSEGMVALTGVREYMLVATMRNLLLYFSSLLERGMCA